ncbi:U box domain-containing protein [Heterostelium album PN500]|uniref:RING-type E3 ubiquitin transferase n=1 Tax=Heterostelium pallidum (strain ATCC 26659 / Pp 5 / PN500) TaxID=670386 RepID=D3BNZ1_HETP5|nr:U box domain-containing protein [Heterostelium album PN500]EFA77001.1 U box domain-containing protein [Heterostelium album PN500]|eukprot:XP_020429132.1 U box domain-containing protein [Heterostelium album PN500]
MKRLLFKLAGQDGEQPEAGAGDNNAQDNQPAAENPEATADDMRRRRMERFQQMEAESQAQGLKQLEQMSKSPSPPLTSPKSTSPPLASSKLAAAATPSSSTTSVKPTTTTTTTTTSTSKPAATTTPSSSSTTTSTVSANAHKIRECEVPMTESDYYILEKILYIYLKPTSENKAVFLKSLATELKSELAASGEKCFKLTPDVLDRFMVERLSTAANYPAVEYLIATYNRLKNESKKKVKQFVQDQAFSNQLVELIVRYLGIILTIPDMFQNSSTPAYGTGPVQLLPYLTGEFTEELSYEFLQSFIDLYQEDKKDIFQPIFSYMSTKMTTITLLGDFLSYFKAFSSLIQFKSLSDIFIGSQYWNPPGNNGAQMETATLLGAYFSPSATSNDRAVLNQYFPSASQLSQHNIREAFVSIHSVLKNYDQGLYQLVRSLLRSSPEAKEAFLVWICSAIDKNAGRTKMNVNAAEVASDGFALNLVAVMILLCEAFVDVSFSKVSMVDTNFLLNSKRHDLSSYTRLSATSEEVEEWQKSKQLEPSPNVNFITECFFVTLRCIHIALNPSFSKIKNISRALRENDNLKRNLNETRSSWQNTPQARLHEANLEMVKKREDLYKGLLLSLEAQLFEQQFIQKTAFFLIFTTKWLLKVINPNDQKLPLPLPPNIQFVALPEFCIEDVVDFFANVSAMFPHYLENLPLEVLVNFFITVLSAPENVKNPYLKAKIVEILSEFIPRDNHPSNNYFASLFECSDLVKENLVPSIMRFYVDIEFTGAHNQFYEKFNYRYQAAHILKYRQIVFDACQQQCQHATLFVAKGGRAIHETRDSRQNLGDDELLPLAIGRTEMHGTQGARTGKMTDIYLFLAVDERFVQSVVRDGRSFKVSMFATADKIMRRERLKNDDEMDKFSKLIERFEQAAREEEQEEEDLGEIPDQYLDPILSTLMRDPVTLPSSKTIVDRQTIVRHLLSDQTDPFNRSKLTEDMLIPNTELKAEIDAWIKSKKQK